MTVLAIVPESATDPLVTRYRAAFDKIKGGWNLFVEGTLELVVVVRDARNRYPHHVEYGRWLERNDLRQISKTDLSAFNKFAEDLVYARQLLEQTKSRSWQQVWRDRPRNRTLPESRKGTISTRGHLSGSNQRKRKRDPIIPTVMRDDYVPGEITKRAAERPAEPRRRRVGRAVDATPPKERPVPRLKTLTREQVDPDFVGTPHDFTRKYGLVNLHTKQELEYHKRQEKLMAWLGALSDFEKAARTVNAEPLDQDTLREWLAKPGKSERFGAWLTMIESAWHSIAPCLDLVRSRKKP